LASRPDSARSDDVWRVMVNSVMQDWSRDMHNLFESLFFLALMPLHICLDCSNTTSVRDGGTECNEVEHVIVRSKVQLLIDPDVRVASHSNFQIMSVLQRQI
jgi:hypothetical protein